MAVHELTAARLLATPAREGHRSRHALLAEAVSAKLLPGERVSVHERVARALETAGGESWLQRRPATGPLLAGLAMS
jgi:hypothetical protein